MLGLLRFVSTAGARHRPRRSRVLGHLGLAVLASWGCSESGVSGPKSSLPAEHVMTRIPLMALEHDAERVVDVVSRSAQRLQGESAPAAAKPAEGDTPAEASPEPRPRSVVAIRRMVEVRKRPDPNAPIIGYVRSGAVVQVHGDPVPTKRCGFVAVLPTGFVCASEVSDDVEQPLAQIWAEGANRRAALPYFYGRSKATPPPLYNRVPSVDEQRRTEPELGGRRHGYQADWVAIANNPTPSFLRDGSSSLRANGLRRSALAVSAGRPIADSAFAFLQLFEAGGRYYGLTTDLSVLPLDHLEPVEPSQFSGVVLGNALQLPVAFVRARNAYLYSGQPSAGLKVERRVEYREAFGLTGEEQRIGARRFLQVHGGQWLIDTPELLVARGPTRMPHWADAGAPWIDVSLQRQTLVAYEGSRPVYATLVSTGLEVMTPPPDPSAAGAEVQTRSTIRGDFRVHTKFVTATMDSDVPGDEYDLRDVPYVQYFEGNYALHAAFWHDDFGKPRSHGCINLSPLDARWLFEWTEPRVPQTWYAALSLLNGTRLRIRP